MPKKIPKHMEKDRETYLDLSKLAESDGGKILIKSILKDLVSNIETLASKYNTMTQNEFVALGADTKVKIDMFRVLQNAPRNKKLVDEAIKKELETLDEE